MISPFVDPRTKEKLVFNEKMTSHVPSEQLLKSHGGSVDFEYEHATYWPELNKLAEERRKQQYERWVRGGKMVGELENYLRGGQETSLKDIIAKSSSESLRKHSSPPGFERETKNVSFGKPEDGDGQRVTQQGAEHVEVVSTIRKDGTSESLARERTSGSLLTSKEPQGETSPVNERMDESKETVVKGDENLKLVDSDLTALGNEVKPAQ